MSSKRRIRRNACQGKKQYTDKAEADRACRVLFAKERWPMTVYRCQFCGAWHVGHMPRKNIRAMRERRAEI